MASAPVAACPATLLDNLAKLEMAQETYRRAQEMRRAGRTEQASRAFEQVRRLCPGSRLDQLAGRHLEKLHGEQVARGGAEEQEAAPAVTAPKTMNTAAKEKKLATLLRRYQEACAEGRLADARKLASRALAMDPACFSKTGK